MGSSGYRYDTFISHAVEDKIPIANELCERLENAGLRVWYSGKELNAGDSIHSTIDAGLAESRYGVIIFSQHYIRKTWTLREFYILLGREKDGRKVILPVLYDVTLQELALKDLDMANRFVIKSDKGLDDVVDKLVTTIRQESKPRKYNRRHVRPAMMVATAVVLMMTLYWFYQVIVVKPVGLTEQFVQNEVQSRIDNLQYKVDNQYLRDFKSAGAQPSEPEVANTFFTNFRDLKSYYSNEYEFCNGYTTVRSRKNVEAALGIDLSALDPANAYKLQAPAVYLLPKKPEVRYVFVNTQPLLYHVSPLHAVGDDAYAVTVTYENNIRFIAVNLLFVKHQTDTRWHRMLLLGLTPTETYVFEKRENGWQVVEVNQQVSERTFWKPEMRQ